MVKPSHDLVIPKVEEPEINPFQEVLNYLEGIPDDKWWIGAFNNIEHTRHCALGHIDRKWPGRKLSQEQFYLVINYRVKRFIARSHGLTSLIYSYSLTDVNDGLCPYYQQPTPKERVIACLKDMIAAGYK